MSALAAIGVSALAILLLSLGDPKRRRVARLPGTAHGTGTRRLLSAAACVPGLWLIAQGQAAAFFIWFGGCAVAGWLVALCHGRRGIRSRDGVSAS